MVSCCVATCKNYHGNKTEQLVFHRFPRDKKLAQTWFLLCRRKDRKKLYPTGAERICSEHFKESDYERDLMNELLDLKIRKGGFLKSGAVPSVNLTISPETTPITSNSSKPTPNSKSKNRNRKDALLYPRPRGSAPYLPTIARKMELSRNGVKRKKTSASASQKSSRLQKNVPAVKGNIEKKKRGRPRMQASSSQSPRKDDEKMKQQKRPVEESPRKASCTKNENSPTDAQRLGENLSGSNEKTVTLPSYTGELLDCTSDLPCKHFIELIEEKALNYKHVRKISELEARIEDLINTNSMYDRFLVENGFEVMNDNDFNTEFAVKEECVDTLVD